MFGGTFDHTPYDLSWRMFGVGVRVKPVFWLLAAFLSWHWIQPLGLQCAMISMACIFVSILIHEFGHIIAMKCFGADGHIVLWGFGGLAFPTHEPEKRWQRIVISLAGPFAEALLLGLVLLLMPLIPNVQPGEWGHKFDFLLWSGIYDPIPYVFLHTMIFLNAFWVVFNLVPMWPLDGGHVSRELFVAVSRRDGVRLSLHLSMGIAGLLAFYSIFAYLNPERRLPFLPGSIFNAVMFGMFGIISWQALQIENQRSHWNDDPWN